MYLWRLHLCVQPCCVCEQSPCVHQLWGCPENLDPPVGWSWWLGTKKGRQVHQKCDGGNVQTNTHREHMLAPAHAQAKSKKKKKTQRTQKCGIHHSMINDRIHGDGSHKHLLLLAINAQWPWQVKKGEKKKGVVFRREAESEMTKCFRTVPHIGQNIKFAIGRGNKRWGCDAQMPPQSQGLNAHLIFF